MPIRLFSPHNLSAKSQVVREILREEQDRRGALLMEGPDGLEDSLAGLFLLAQTKKL